MDEPRVGVHQRMVRGLDLRPWLLVFIKKNIDHAKKGHNYIGPQLCRRVPRTVGKLSPRRSFWVPYTRAIDMPSAMAEEAMDEARVGVRWQMVRGLRSSVVAVQHSIGWANTYGQHYLGPTLRANTT